MSDKLAETPQPDTMLRALNQGKLTIAGFEMSCYVLDTPDKDRVLSRQGLLRALGRNEKPTRVKEQVDTMPNFLRAANLKPFISNELIESTKPIHFKASTGKQTIIGFRADILSAICYVFIDAHKAGVLKPQQVHIAERCDLLVRGFASVGLRALVDEATGFQEVRERDDLQRYLDAFLLKEHAKWAKRFPDDFFQLLFEMMGWQWNELSTKRPLYIGKMINNLVYERLAPLVLEELRLKNPPNDKGQRKVKHHQFLTPDIGHSKLQEHIFALKALLRASGGDKVKFEDMVNTALPRYGHTIPIQFSESDKPRPVPVAEMNRSVKALLSVPPPQKDKPKGNK